jgi:YVTN family beta-propeller protein
MGRADNEVHNLHRANTSSKSLVVDRHRDQYGGRQADPSRQLPFGVAVTLDGSKVYVVNQGSNTVSVIDTVTNTVVGLPIPVGATPIAFGSFIQPHGCKDGGWLNFASSPGPFKNEGQCVSYFAKQP